MAPARQYSVEVGVWWNNTTGGWEVDFERTAEAPTVAYFTTAITTHPTPRKHRDQVAVATEADAAVRWARAMQAPNAAGHPGHAESTDQDGYVLEVAVLDAATARGPSSAGPTSFARRSGAADHSVWPNRSS